MIFMYIMHNGANILLCDNFYVTTPLHARVRRGTGSWGGNLGPHCPQSLSGRYLCVQGHTYGVLARQLSQGRNAVEGRELQGRVGLGGWKKPPNANPVAAFAFARLEFNIIMQYASISLIQSTTLMVFETVLLIATLFFMRIMVT